MSALDKGRARSGIGSTRVGLMVAHTYKLNSALLNIFNGCIHLNLKKRKKPLI